MGHLQKTPAGLARRILNFEEESSLASSLKSTTLTEAKIPVTAEYPIETICEAAETPLIIHSSDELPTQPAPASNVRQTKKVNAETHRPSKTTETTNCSRASSTRVKSSPIWKVGKASKNAVNSEVQSLSLAHKVQSPATVFQRVQSVASKVSSSNPPIKSQPTQTQSWAQRVQNVLPPSQQLTKSKPNKLEPQVKHVVKQQVTPRQQSQALLVPISNSTDVNEGWETVRGRTRSRTSPAKGVPMLTRASTMVYGSRLEAKQSIKASPRQQLSRPGLLKTTVAQSLPSLCDRVLDNCELPKEDKVELQEVATTIPSCIATQAISNDDASIVVSSGEEDKDEAEEAAEVAKEEAEMARREEALTMEEENLRREMRETERSDNEGDETWEDPINVTPVSLRDCLNFDRISPLKANLILRRRRLQKVFLSVLLIDYQ